MDTGKLNALIVDDSEISRRVTARIIDKVFCYDEAENGLVAVNKYKNAHESGVPFDIVFMDIVMPEMDGKEAVQKIREYEENLACPRVPIIVVSASERIDEIEALINGLLRKVVNRQSLDALLQQLFDGKVNLLH